MSDGRSPFARFFFLALCLAVTALGLNNTYGDNSAVVDKAKAATCGSGDCTYQTLRQERSPFSQSFTFQVSLTEKGRQRAASADVKCARAYVLLGEYECQVVSGGLPGVAAPAGS